MKRKATFLGRGVGSKQNIRRQKETSYYLIWGPSFPESFRPDPSILKNEIIIFKWGFSEPLWNVITWVVNMKIVMRFWAFWEPKMKRTSLGWDKECKYCAQERRTRHYKMDCVLGKGKALLLFVLDCQFQLGATSLAKHIIASTPHQTWTHKGRVYIWGCWACGPKDSVQSEEVFLYC